MRQEVSHPILSLRAEAHDTLSPWRESLRDVAAEVAVFRGPDLSSNGTPQLYRRTVKRRLSHHGPSNVSIARWNFE
jgi:hypothetical protein